MCDTIKGAPDDVQKELQLAWFHVWECLKQLRNDQASKGGVSGGLICALEWWRLFGEEIGLDERSIVKGLLKDKVDNLKGCSWTKCPRFRDDAPESQLRFLRCATCKSVSPRAG